MLRLNVVSVLLAVSLACFAKHTSAKSQQLGLHVSPAFIWGPGPYIASKQDDPQTRVSYEVLHSDVLTNDILKGIISQGFSDAAAAYLDAKGLADQPPEVVLLYLGTQLRTQDLAKASLSNTLGPLNAALQKASSSLALPHLSHLGDKSLTAAVLSSLQQPGQPVQLHVSGSCSAAGGDAAVEAKEALQAGAAGGKLQVLVACSEAGAMLESEMAALKELQEIVEGSGKQHMFVYISDSRADDATRVGRHLLQETSAPTPSPSPDVPYVCDDKCRTQVNQLEAGILILTVFVSLSLAVYCMGILDTPTRFETPKDHGS